MAAREIKGEIGMGIKGWYMAEDNSAGRSMTAENNYREVAARQAPPRRVTAREHAVREPAVREPRARHRAPAKPTSSYTEFNAVDNSVQSGTRPGNRVTVRDLAAHDAEIIKAERPSRKVEAAKAEKAAQAPTKQIARKKKKSAAGAVIGTMGVLIVVAAAAAGGWYYLADKQGKGNLKKKLSLKPVRALRSKTSFRIALSMRNS